MSDDLEKRFEHLGKAADLLKAQAAEITRLRAVSDEVRGYLSRLLQSLHPAIDLLPNVLGVCTQIDNVLAGQREEITLLRAALATARREGMEMPDAFMQWVKREMPPGTVINSPEWWASKMWGAALATARREGKSGEHLSEAEQERDEFFNRLGRITEYLDLPVDATAQRIIETICERVENEREACASVEVRVIVPEGAETWTPLEAWEEAIIAFDEAFRYAIRAAAGEDREP
jgi:hypothetical protein